VVTAAKLPASQYSAAAGAAGVTTLNRLRVLQRFCAKPEKRNVKSK